MSVSCVSFFDRAKRRPEDGDVHQARDAFERAALVVAIRPASRFVSPSFTGSSC
jgi:hypothetical protein